MKLDKEDIYYGTYSYDSYPSNFIRKCTFRRIFTDKFPVSNMNWANIVTLMSCGYSTTLWTSTYNSLQTRITHIK